LLLPSISRSSPFIPSPFGIVAFFFPFVSLKNCLQAFFFFDLLLFQFFSMRPRLMRTSLCVVSSPASHQFSFFSPFCRLVSVVRFLLPAAAYFSGGKLRQFCLRRTVSILIPLFRLLDPLGGCFLPVQLHCVFEWFNFFLRAGFASPSVSFLACLLPFLFRRFFSRRSSAPDSPLPYPFF